tara:strand:- start:1714 stop:2076 length:363 start_codon:yes stop_codon:yes gene_type:complete
MNKLKPKLILKSKSGSESKSNSKSNSKSKSNKRKLPKSRSKKKKSKRNGSRKIRIKKEKKVTEKDVERLQKHIELVRSKKTNDIKKELESEGIKISGKSNRLLKDIYLYSKICRINIKHE